jgi:hypothetical protein
MKSLARNDVTVFSMLSERILHKGHLLLLRLVRGPGEFLVEFRGYRVIQQEMARRLQSDLKC